MVSLEQRRAFYDKLRRHDWYYEMSEDPGVWRRGRESMQAIESAMKDVTELADLYNAYAGYVFNNEPKPEKPT